MGTAPAHKPRHRRGVAAAALALAAALAPAGRGPATPAESPSRERAGEAGPDIAASGGCGRADPGTGDAMAETTDGRGLLRRYRVRVAGPYDPARPRALTIVFHGGGSDDAGAMSLGLQDVAAAAAASVFAFPRGVPFGNDGVGWNAACGGYDMAFFDNMVASIEARYCIDPGRIFVAGFSWGCDFVTALACCRGDRLAAVAAASCSDDFRDPGDAGTYVNRTCPVPNRAAVRFTHAVGHDSLYPAPLFATTASLFAKLNHCAAAPPPEAGASVCRAYAGCRHDVVDCAIPGIDHATGPHWAQDTWAFFERAGRAP